MDEDTQFSQPLQFIVPSLSSLIHSSFHETPVHGTYIHNNILFIKLIPTILLPLLSPHAVLGWKAVPVFLHHLKH